MNNEFDFEAEEARLLDRIAELETELKSLRAAPKRAAPKRQENSDVFPGFRGNNDYA